MNTNIAPNTSTLNAPVNLINKLNLKTIKEEIVIKLKNSFEQSISHLENPDKNIVKNIFNEFQKKYIDTINITSTDAFPTFERFEKVLENKNFKNHKEILQLLYAENLFPFIPDSKSLSETQSSKLKIVFNEFAEKILIDSLGFSEKTLKEFYTYAEKMITRFKPYYEILSHIPDFNNYTIEDYDFIKSDLESIAGVYIVSKLSVSAITESINTLKNTDKEITEGKVSISEETLLEKAKLKLVSCKKLLSNYLNLSNEKSFNATAKNLLKYKKFIKNPATNSQKPVSPTETVTPNTKKEPINVVMDDIDRLIAKINSYGIQNIELINNNIHNLPKINFNNRVFSVLKFEHKVNGYTLTINYNQHVAFIAEFDKSKIKTALIAYSRSLGTSYQETILKDFVTHMLSKSFSGKEVTITDEKVIVDMVDAKNQLIHIKNTPNELLFDISSKRIKIIHEIFLAARHDSDIDAALKKHWIGVEAKKDGKHSIIQLFLDGSKHIGKEKTFENIKLFFEENKELVKYFKTYNKYGKLRNIAVNELKRAA